MTNRSLLKCASSLFWNMAAATLICLIIFSALGFLIEYTVGVVVMQVLMLMIYGGMIYSNLWAVGDRDSNLYQFGHIKRDWLFGVKVSLIASVPLFLMNLLLLVSKAGWMPNWLWIYKLLNVQFMPIVNLYMPSGYVKDAGWLELLSLFLVDLSVTALGGWGYIMGFQRISLTQKLVYKDNGKKKARK